VPRILNACAGLLFLHKQPRHHIQPYPPEPSPLGVISQEIKADSGFAMTPSPKDMISENAPVSAPDGDVSRNFHLFLFLVL
jgi:hypothetical protein